MNKLAARINKFPFLAAFAIAAVLIFLSLLKPPLTRAQSQTQLANPDFSSFVYDVASIKPGEQFLDRPIMLRMQPTPDGYTATNTNLFLLLSTAFGQLRRNQVVGAPDWASSQTYVLEAKMDPSVAEALLKLSPDDQKLAGQHMMQQLLAGRFKLVIHRETKDMPVYLLAVSKPGKLHEDEGDCGPDANAPPQPPVPGKMPAARCGGFITYPSHIAGLKVTLAQFAGVLPSQLQGQSVVDKTGLAGKYDITLNWTPDEGAPTFPGAPEFDQNGPPLLTAIQEQLGLKLESGKAPMQIIVIDHVEKPSGN